MNIKKILFFSLPILLTIILCCCSTGTNEKKVGVIVPLENKALEDIVAGYTQTLKANVKQPFQLKIANAQGDLNIQRAIIAQMKAENYTVIAPIGMAATQMTLAMTKQPVVGIAANYTDKERNDLKTCNLAAVRDEIPAEKIVEFIHSVYPNITQLTLIHSGTEKIYADVQVAIASGKKLGITITPMMAPTLNDLYSVANSLPKNTQGILILKDILIASGTPTLAHVAETRHIPFISADQGSVQDGATFAVGVYEKNIGVESALLTEKILQGDRPCDLAIVSMKHLTVFINRNSVTKENLSLEPIEQAAKSHEYDIHFVAQPRS